MLRLSELKCGCIMILAHERHFSRVAWWAQDAAEASLDIVLIGYKVRTSNLEQAYSDSRSHAGSIGALQLLPLSGQQHIRDAFEWAANVT